MAGSGQIYSYSDSTTTKRTIPNLITMLNPNDIKLQVRFGLNNQSKFGLQNFPNHKIEWLEDTNRIKTATLGEAMDTTETGMDVASGHGVRFHVGDVWRSDETGELIYISAITAGSDTITTVIRNWNGAMGGSQGTATSSITTATGLTLLYSAMQEGFDSVAYPFTTATAPYNYSQIFHAEIKVSGSEQDATSRYGVPDQYKRQLMKILGGAGGGNGTKGRAGDLPLELEKTWFYGTRLARSNGVAGAMGGFKTFVTTNANSAGGTLTRKTLEDSIQSAWAVGGMPDLIICNAYNKRLITSWYEPVVRTQRTEKIGGSIVSTVETEFGELDVMLHRFCPAGEVDIVQSDLVGWVMLRDWTVEPLAKDGDYRKDMVLGEFSLIVQNELSHAIITGLTTG